MLMTKQITGDQRLLYVCICGNQEPAGDEATLMFEELIDVFDTGEKHDVMIANSPRDPARSIIMGKCPSCGLDHLTQIMVGVDMVTLLTCECGYKATYNEYMAGLAPQQPPQ
jgi:hypothetical protein